MPRRRSKIDDVVQILAKKYGDELARVFLDAMASVADSAKLSDIIEAIKAREFDKVVKILGIDPPAFRGIETTIQQGFETGGQTVAATLPPALEAAAGVNSVFRFDVRNTRAEEWLRTHSSGLVTRITADTREAVQTALQTGMVAGANPRTVALDIVGRVDPLTGRRAGGIIGLTKPQAQFVTNARSELASGTATDLENYLTRKLRDKRFDPYVHEAIKNGTKIDADIRSKMVGRYSDRLLKLRGDTVGRTEMIETLNHAQWEAYNQATEKGSLAPNAAKKEWDSSGHDGRTRDSHLALDAEPPIPMNQPFISPVTGAQMMFPGDKSLGAPGADTINCRCRVRWKIDFFAGLKKEPTPTPQPRPPMPPKPPTVAERNAVLNEEAKAYVISKGLADGNEHLTAFDAVTGEKFAPYTSGQKGFVGFSPEIENAIRDNRREIILHHNHRLAIRTFKRLSTRRGR